MEGSWPRLSRRELVRGAAAVGVVLATPRLFAGCVGPTLPPEPQTRVPRIGFLGPAVALPELRAGMAEIGYNEGQNLVVEHRETGGPSGVKDAADELVALKVDVIVAGNVLAAMGAKAETATIPIVATGGGGTGDLVASGVVPSLARSDNNVTGLTVPGIGGKQLQLLAESVPEARRIAVLYQDSPVGRDRGLEDPARQLGLQLLPFDVRRRDELEAAFAEAVRQQADALFVLPGGVVAEGLRQVADLARLHRLPSMADTRGFVPAGGLMYYGPNAVEQYRRVAYYVDRILKGAKPGDLPLEQPMLFDFQVNMKTARELGITFPPEILLQVTQVYE